MKYNSSQNENGRNMLITIWRSLSIHSGMYAEIAGNMSAWNLIGSTRTVSSLKQLCIFHVRYLTLLFVMLPQLTSNRIFIFPFFIMLLHIQWGYVPEINEILWHFVVVLSVKYLSRCAVRLHKEIIYRKEWYYRKTIYENIYLIITKCSIFRKVQCYIDGFKCHRKQTISNDFKFIPTPLHWVRRAFCILNAFTLTF